MHYVYNKRMVATTTSYSPSSRKPALVVEDWEAAGLRLKRHPVTPTTHAELCLAHDRAYVDGILKGELPNGFNNHDPEIAASLPWTVGAMLTAARIALKTQMPVCAPVSGFHHAHFDRGGGFCTFNGLMVTALTLLSEEQVREVWIIDCDHHYGDGTVNILSRLPPKLARRIRHWTAGGHELTQQAAIREPAGQVYEWRQQAGEIGNRCEDCLVLY